MPICDMVSTGRYTVSSPHVYDDFFNTGQLIDEIHVHESDETNTEIQELSFTSDSGEYRTVETDRLQSLINGGHIQKE